MNLDNEQTGLRAYRSTHARPTPHLDLVDVDPHICTAPHHLAGGRKDLARNCSGNPQARIREPEEAHRARKVNLKSTLGCDRYRDIVIRVSRTLRCPVE
jgi:hypothetical protein